MKITLICLFFLLCFSIYSITGDVNGDGNINIVDSLMIAQYAVGLRPSGFLSAAADVDVSGTINIIDALIIAQYYVSIIPYFPSSTYKRLPVPLIKQNPDMCGAACGMMYLSYKKNVFGTSGLTIPSQTDIYNLMRTSDPSTGSAPGVTATGIYKGLNNLLYKYTQINSQSYTKCYSINNSTVTDNTALVGQLFLIKQYEPSIVFWYSATVGHYVVMIGYDEVKNEILYNDPADNSFRQMSLNEWLTKDYIPDTKERLFIAKVVTM